MKVKDTAIVLQVVKYADKKNIVRLFGLNTGIISAVANFSNSKFSKIKASCFAPLNILEIDMEIKENRTVNVLSEVNHAYVYQNIYKDLNKLSIFQFISEFLNITMVNESKNQELFYFLLDNLKLLDQQESNFSSFHHKFLIQLIQYFGFSPANNFNTSNCYFDCVEGKFNSLEKIYPMGLNKEQSYAFKKLLESNSVNTLNKIERQLALEGLLAYYQMHIPGFREPKSLKIIKEVVNA
ncbi:MAG: DNA repair protein RecO [Bacteroidia bacterium]